MNGSLYEFFIVFNYYFHGVLTSFVVVVVVLGSVAKQRRDTNELPIILQVVLLITYCIFV